MGIDIGFGQVTFNSTRYIRNRKGKEEEVKAVPAFNSTRYIRNSYEGVEGKG